MYKTDLLDTLGQRKPPVDLHEALSLPLPVLMICELLGVPYEDRVEVRAWSDEFAQMVTGSCRRRPWATSSGT